MKTLGYGARDRDYEETMPNSTYVDRTPFSTSGVLQGVEFYASRLDNRELKLWIFKPNSKAACDVKPVKSTTISMISSVTERYLGYTKVRIIF